MAKPQEVGRAIFSAIFLVGAMANILILISGPGAYDTFAERSFLAVYRQAWSSIVLPNLELLVGLAVLFELAPAILFLGRGSVVRVAFVLAAVFMISLFPFWWSGASILDLGLAALLVRLALSRCPASVLQLLGSTPPAVE